MSLLASASLPIVFPAKLTVVWSTPSIHGPICLENDTSTDTCGSSECSKLLSPGRHASGHRLNGGQAALDQALVDDVQRLLVQPLPGSLIPRVGVAGLAHGCVVEVQRQQPQPWRAEV